MLNKKSYCLMLILMLSSVIQSGADIPRTMYVINESAETLSKMNLENNAIQTNVVATGQMPNQIAVHNDMIYVVNSGSDNIMGIDPKNDSQIKQTIALPEGSNPWAIGFVGAQKAYITNWLANTVAVIDLKSGTVVKEIEVGTAPQGILVYGNKAFIANTGYNISSYTYSQSSVSIIDVINDSVTHTVAVPTNAQEFAVDPIGRIHVMCTGDYMTVSGQVAVMDVHDPVPTVIDTIEFGWIEAGAVTFAPGDIEITKDGKGYCIAWGDGTNGFLCSYDALEDSVLRSAANPILVGPNVSQLHFDAKENALWIPYMTMWGGDGFVQKFDVQLDSVVWISGVLGNGTKSLAILEPVQQTAVQHESLNQPIEFQLSQNYPNPFNPTTNISFSVDRTRHVELKIYNAMGQEITTLVNGMKSQGTHQVKWDGRDYDGNMVTNGIYLYRLKSGNNTHIRKMTFIK